MFVILWLYHLPVIYSTGFYGMVKENEYKFYNTCYMLSASMLFYASRYGALQSAMAVA